MKTAYLPSFIKDLKRLKSSSVYQNIKTLTFEKIRRICFIIRE